MTVQSLILFLQSYKWEVAIVLLIAGCIKIPAYEIRLLPFLIRKALRGFGSVINEEIVERIEILEKGFAMCSIDMKDELIAHIKRTEEENVNRARSRILRFNDEIMLGRKHSKEHFDEILQDIDRYEDYCKTHEDFENNKAVLAIRTIKDEYTYCLAHHNFLTYTQKQ